MIYLKFSKLLTVLLNVECGKNIFRLSRSNRNIIRKTNVNYNAKNSAIICKLMSSFLPERVINYCNNLPNYVKSSVDVPSFKSNFTIVKIIIGKYQI